VYPLAADLDREGVGDVIEVGGYLHRELAARDEHRLQPCEQRGMIANPLQRRVGEDDVERRIRLPFADVATRERQAFYLEPARAFEHRIRRIDPEGLLRCELAM
jgi:hypothetical protein